MTVVEHSSNTEGIPFGVPSFLFVSKLPFRLGFAVPCDFYAV